MAADQWDQAQRHIDRALWLHSARVSTNLLAARIARHRGAYSQAENYLTRCGQDAANSDDIGLEWQLIRCQRGEVDQLSPNLLALVERNHPQSAAILEALASVYMHQLRYVEALRCLERWLQVAPESVRALDWHGWVCNQLDLHERAILDYKHVLELQPGRSAVQLRLADLYVETSNTNEALPLLEQVRREQPDNPLVLVDLARCWAAQAQTEEAEKLLDSVLAAHPTHFDALLQRGKLEKESNHLVEAEHWLRKALAQKPCDPEARYTLFLCLKAQSNRQAEAREAEARWRADTKARDRLLDLLRTQVVQRANDPDLAGEVGELLLRQGEEPWGLFWLHRALKLDPRHASSHRALMAYYERTNDPAKAAYHRQQLVAAGKK